MLIQRNIPLSDITTIKIGGTANIDVTVTTLNDMFSALRLAQESLLPFRVLGSGSNVIGCDGGFDGVIILNKINDLQFLEMDENRTCVLIRAGAEEILDKVVARTVEVGLSGLEALSGIPGTIGAAPVQNAGAYGQEISDHIESIEVIDTRTMRTALFTKAQCAFAYRDSVFKHNDRRYVITAVTLFLTRMEPQPPLYTTLASYFTKSGMVKYTAGMVRDAVLLIRSEKLPSPQLLPNVGSFFKNPIIGTSFANALKKQNPEMPLNEAGLNQAKLSAGWLVENAGFRNYVSGPLKTYEKNALVVVNTGNAIYEDLVTFRDLIIRVVEDRFGVKLFQEPEEL